MKFITCILLTALLSFLTCLYLDWWSIALAAFTVSIFIHQKPARAFLTGFLALFLLWGGLSWWIDMKNEHVLAGKLAAILPFGGAVFLMILVTAVIGGLVAGFAALTASYARERK